MTGGYTTIDEYLDGVDAGKRAALEKLRRDIRSAAPKAEECISYGVPAFRLDGTFLVAFGAAASHCSFYPGGAPLAAYGKELAGFSTSKGTVRFQPEHPLPAALVRKLVRVRIGKVLGDRGKKVPSGREGSRRRRGRRGAGPAHGSPARGRNSKAGA